jgi:hypothetical protein
MSLRHADNGRSASLSHDSATYIDASASIRCRRDYLIIEPMAADLSKTIAVIERTRPVRGTVRAVGPGHYPKRYDHPDKHVRTKTWDSKTFQPTECKVGDIVELGGIELGGYAFQTFLWGDVVHLICREADVSGIITLLHDESGNVIHRECSLPMQMDAGPCIGADPACPCQDGDPCHYRDAPDGSTKAWPVPA